MADLLALSTRIIDSGHADEPVNRSTNELSEIAPDLALVESFSHAAVWDTGAGLVSFDTSGVHTGADVVTSIRSWRPEVPFSHLVYTHGHADHVGGSGFFAADALDRGHLRPEVIGHLNVDTRLDRYDLTSSWNLFINARQFGGLRSELNLNIGSDETGVEVEVRETARRFLPRSVLRPSTVVADHAAMTIGDQRLEFFHDRGETDDHLWIWAPDRKWLFSGDFVIWNFPNAGNPQKVQRYPQDWAMALRKMIAVGPELLVPAHGLPIEGRDRIARVLDEIATALENLERNVLAMMNAGETLDAIIHSVRVPGETLAKPYLRPLYDEPEFVIRNIWRLYGGWWDGAASRLKPAPDASLATAIADLAGGADRLIEQAERIHDSGDQRLACHLADLAGWAAPEDPGIHAIRARLYLARRKAESSLMAKGIYLSAARESQAIVERATPGAPTGK